MAIKSSVLGSMLFIMVPLLAAVFMVPLLSNFFAPHCVISVGGYLDNVYISCSVRFFRCSNLSQYASDRGDERAAVGMALVKPPWRVLVCY